MLKTIIFLKTQLLENKTSSLREYFYHTLNWISEAQFETINDSNKNLENLEILFDVLREDFNIHAEAEGTVFGPLVVETTSRSGTKKITHCSKDVTTSGFLLPRKFEDLKVLKCDAQLILTIETGGMMNRLIEDRFDEKYGILLVLTKGYASRVTRKFVRYMSQKYDLKVRAFNDGDPHGMRIFTTLKQGAIKSSHISEKLCTPNAKLLGLLPSHIKKWNLPTDDLTKEEKNVLDIMIEDPLTEESLKEELKVMKESGKKAEQQALAFHGLSFVTEEYLPYLFELEGIKKIAL